MEINKEFELIQDAHNVILIHNKPFPAGVAMGKPYPAGTKEHKSFYPDIEKACIGFLRKSVDTGSMQTILDSIQQCKADIIALTRNIQEAKL